MRSPAARAGRWWEPLKYIPLDEKSYLTLGAELRLRFESIENDNWGLGNDDAYLWLRFMPYADPHASDSIRLFGQLIMADAIDRELVTPGQSSGDDDVEIALPICGAPI